MQEFACAVSILINIIEGPAWCSPRHFALICDRTIWFQKKKKMATV